VADGLAPRSALAEAVFPRGRSGILGDRPGVVVEEILPAGAASLEAHRDRLPALLEAAQKNFGLALPMQPRWEEGGGMRAIWTGPKRWLVLGPADTATILRGELGDAASIADQTDARVILTVSGARARDALAKGIGIDLHPSAFRTGDAAVTQAARMAVTLWQLDDTPAYALAVARSYAGSLAEWLAGAAAEFGLLVVG